MKSIPEPGSTLKRQSKSVNNPVDQPQHVTHVPKTRFFMPQAAIGSTEYRVSGLFLHKAALRTGQGAI